MSWFSPLNGYRGVFCMNRGLSEREAVFNSSTPTHWANSNIPAISEGGGEQREHPDSEIVRHSHGDIQKYKQRQRARPTKGSRVYEKDTGETCSVPSHEPAAVLGLLARTNGSLCSLRGALSSLFKGLRIPHTILLAPQEANAHHRHTTITKMCVRVFSPHCGAR